MLDQLSSLDQAKNTLIDLAIRFGPKALAAIVILVAGFYVGGWNALRGGGHVARYQN